MSPSLDAELRHHAGALRELARALVGDTDADDLVQDAAMQALRTTQRPESLRSWLSAVLRHLAGKHHRARSRRRMHEGRAKPATPPPAPDRQAEHRETLLRLTAALTALPEPYQGTLLLRYFEDLLPAAIAAQTGVPLATVKSRLQRGIAMLRERLGADGRSEWRPALGAAFGLEVMGKTTAAATIAVTGVLLMSTGAKLALSGIAALLALAAWFWFGSAALPEQRPVVSAPDAVTRPATADLGARTPGPSERRDVTPPPPGAAASDLAVLRGRCVDESGRPLPRCEVELRGSKTADRGRVELSRAYGLWLVAHPDAGWRDLQTTTAADGTFQFAFAAPPLDYQLRLRRDVIDHELHVGEVDPGTPRDVGDVILPVTCLVTGRVVDTAGSLVANAAVVLTSAAPAKTRTPSDTTSDTGADGRFEVRVLAGGYRVGVAFRSVVRGGTVEVAAGVDRLDVEVVIEPVAAADTITGTVVNNEGAPVAAATVQAIGVVSSFARTDANGRFSLSRPAGKGDSVLLFAGRDGCSSESRSCAWGTHDLRLVISGEPGSNIELRAITTDGKPVTDFAVRFYPPNMTYAMVQAPPGGHHEEGIARLTAVPKSLRFLLIEPDRWDLWNSGFVALPTTAAANLRLDIALPAAAERTLRVLRSDATPAGGITVELLDPAFAPPSLSASAATLASIRDPSYKGYGPGYKQLVLQLQRGNTDAHGELRLHGPVGMPLALRLLGSGHAPMLIPGVTLDPQDPLVVTLPPSARLEGTLSPIALVHELRQVCGLPADGPVPPGHARAKDQGFRLRRGQGADAEWIPPAPEPGALPAGDGTFAIDGVPPGTWQLTLARWDENYVVLEKLETVATVELRAGETTPVAVELPDWVTAVLEGQVLSNGRPFARQGLDVYLDDGRHRISRQVGTDAEGRFQARLRQGTVRVATSQMTQRGNLVSFDVIKAREQVFVQGGQSVSQVFHLDTGKLKLRLLDADGQAVRGFGLYLRSDDGLLHKTGDSDADGRIALDIEPATFTLLAMPQRLRDADRKLFGNTWTIAAPDPLAVNLLSAGSVTAKAGETVEHDVHLPPEWNR